MPMRKNLCKVIIKDFAASGYTSEKYKLSLKKGMVIFFLDAESITAVMDVVGLFVAAFLFPCCSLFPSLSLSLSLCVCVCVCVCLSVCVCCKVM